MTIKSLLNKTQMIVLSIGVGFLLFGSESLKLALGMAGAVVCVLLLSTLVMMLLGKFVKGDAKLVAAILVTMGFSSIATMLMQAWVPTIATGLGIHLSALGIELVNLYGDHELEKLDNKINTIVNILLYSLVFVVLVLVSAVIREVLGEASIFGVSIKFLEGFKVKTLCGAFGGYVVCAIVLAVVQKIASSIKEKEVTTDVE